MQSDDRVPAELDDPPGGTRAPGLAWVSLQPRQVEKMSPCTADCAVGGDVRGWIGVIAQRRKLGISDEEAYARAWNAIAAVNPFPATLGRICPHPCETHCTRASRDGAVAINALERFLGDWALRQRLALPVLEKRPQPESIGVIGAGPAGLSFAYQMVRRGYRVTMYEREEFPGGMPKHGIPRFRLPAEVLDTEIRRVIDLGVELRPRTALGRGIAAGELRKRHRVLFIGIGAARGVRLNVPGERGKGVWLGVDYLRAVNHGEAVVLGARVVVIGGGNTAVDAARVARRRGAAVTILYRRTSAEMLANAREIEAARSEGVVLQELASPVRIERSGGLVTGVVAQRMHLADTDASGRRGAVPLAGAEFALPADAVIVAVSQEIDWSGVEEFDLPGRLDASQVIDSRRLRVVAGGDVLKPGIAASAIAEGRRAAEAVHAKLRGLPQARRDVAPVSSPGLVVKTESYLPGERTCVPSVSVAERMLHADSEIERTLSEEAFLGEVARCFSCGLCFGCEQCYMHCNAAAFSRAETIAPGAYFALDLERCEGCAKCVELCPCGFLSMAS